MSVAAATGVSLLRSVAVVILSVPLLHPLVAWLRGTPRPVRRCHWALLLAPALFPGLVTGYAYANSALSLVHYPVLNQVLCAGLLVMRVVPIGVLLLYVAPPPPIDEWALHCRRLGLQRDRFRLSGRLSYLAFWIRGPARHALVAGSLVFLLVFQEFELLSLMGTTAWTVWLFDAQAGGLMLSDSLGAAALPLAAQAAALAPLATLVYMSRGLGSPLPQARPTRNLKWSRLLAAAYVVVALAVCCVLPCAFVFRGSWTGLIVLAENFTLTKDIFVGIVSASIAGTVAYVTATWLISGSSSESSRLRWLVTLLACIPGACGSLILSLGVLYVFQRPWLSPLYDSPLPWLVGLTLFLMPRAVAIRLIQLATGRRDSVHLAHLLCASSRREHHDMASDLQWTLVWRRHFWSLSLIVFWGYLDVTTAAVLSPASMVSAPVRMYNLMHYGQSAVLSAMVCATFIIPLAVVLAPATLRRPLTRLLLRGSQ